MLLEGRLTDGRPIRHIAWLLVGMDCFRHIGCPSTWIDKVCKRPSLTPLNGGFCVYCCLLKSGISDSAVLKRGIEVFMFDSNIDFHFMYMLNKESRSN